MFVTNFGIASKQKIICVNNEVSTIESLLQHIKLSYLNFKTMNSIVQKELVSGLPQLGFKKNEMCEVCQKRKVKESITQKKGYV